MFKAVGTAISTLWKWKGTLGLGGLGAYFWSASEEKPEDRDFYNAANKFGSEVLGPTLYNVGEKIGKGVTHVVGDFAHSDDDKKTGVGQPLRDGIGNLLTGLRGPAEELIASAQHAPQVAEKIAEKGGEFAGASADTAANSLEKFLKGILPESLMPPKWLLYTGAAVLGAAGIGSATGFNAFNLGTLGTLAMAPLKFVGTALGGALGPLITGGAVIAGMGLLISPTMRQMAWDLFEGITNLLPGKQKEGHTPEPVVAPPKAPEATREPVTAAPAADVSRVEVNPELMRSVSGGNTAENIVMRETPATSPSRDARNAPNFTAAV